MKKKDLLNKIEDKKAVIAQLVEEEKLDEAEAETAELDGLEKELKDLERKEAIVNKIGSGIKKEDKMPVNPVENKGKSAFFNYLKSGYANMMTEGVMQDGGYTVPVDIQTAINQYKEETATLRNYVTVVPVKTLSGARNFRKRKTARRGMDLILEGGEAQAGTQPSYERLSYSVNKYGKVYSATDELMADSDVNIQSELVNWIVGESNDTDNTLILDVIESFAKQTVNGLDDLKKVFNVQLGQALRLGSIVMTNDDGWNYLDTLKDNDGKYVLQPSPVDPTVKRLFGQYEVVVVPNSFLPSNVSEAGKRKVPFYCGNFKEGIVIFDRQSTTIKSSNNAIGGGFNAFTQGGMLFACTIREEVKVKDNEAIVACELTIPDSSVVGEVVGE